MPLLNITVSGYYAITADYTASSPTDDAVVVAPGVHNVIILLYSRLICPAAFSTGRQNAGIRLSNSNAVTVLGMGGHIRGFGFGLRADNCDNVTVDNLCIPDALMRGIKIEGNSAVVRNSLIRSVYGSTFTPNQYCMGLEMSGVAPTAMGNTIRDFRGTDNGEGVGLSITDQGIGGIVKGNASMGTLLNDEPRAKTIAYWVGGASDVDFVHNHGANCNWGLAASSPTSGLFDENSFRHCTTEFNASPVNWIIGGSDG